MNKQKKNLCIQLNDLASMDLLSKSDPFVVVSIKNSGDSKWTQIGNTETKINDNDPVFCKRILIEFEKTDDLVIRFEVFDQDENSDELKKHDFIAEVVYTLKELLSSSPVKKSFNCKSVSKRVAMMTVKLEDFVPSTHVFSIQFRGRRLPRKDLFSSDPFFKLYSLINGEWRMVYESEVIYSNRSPVWKEFKINSYDLCANDFLNCEMKMVIYDYNNLSKNDLMGEFSFKPNDLGPSSSFEIYKSNKKKKGKIEIMNFRKTPKYYLEQYMKSGYQISTILAVDFSKASYVDTSKKGPSYSADDQQEIEAAVLSIGSLLESIDENNQFPIWAFSSGNSNNSQGSIINLTFDPNIPKARGLNGVISCLRNGFSNLSLGNSKNLSDLMMTTKSLVEKHLIGHPKSYVVLFVFLKQGDLRDKGSVSSYISSLVDLPISIVFMQLGSKNPSVMSIFSDYYARKFITVANYKDHVKRLSFGSASRTLSSGIFTSLKSQMMEYFRYKNIVPRMDATTNTITKGDGFTQSPGFANPLNTNQQRTMPMGNNPMYNNPMANQPMPNQPMPNQPMPNNPMYNNPMYSNPMTANFVNPIQNAQRAQNPNIPQGYSYNPNAHPMENLQPNYNQMNKPTMNQQKNVYPNYNEMNKQRTNPQQNAQNPMWQPSMSNPGPKNAMQSTSFNMGQAAPGNNYPPRNPQQQGFTLPYNVNNPGNTGQK